MPIGVMTIKLEKLIISIRYFTDFERAIKFTFSKIKYH